MRAVVAVLLFVTAVHAALWGLLQEKREAPDFKGMLPSLSYAPFDGTGHPDVDNIPNADKIRADLKKLDRPTLIVHGSDDQIVPIDISARVVSSMLPSATLKVYEGAPHGLVFTHRDRLNADLLNFLRT